MSETLGDEDTQFKQAEALRTLSAESEGQPQDVVSAFETEKGSVYRYDTDGRTARFKTATSEQMPTQGLTVFVNPNEQQAQDIVNAYLPQGNNPEAKVEIVERQPGSGGKIVRDIADVKDRRNLNLVVMEGGRVTMLLPASVFPAVGQQVYDTRDYEDGGNNRTDRHLGHKVTRIDYRA